MSFKQYLDKKAIYETNIDLNKDERFFTLRVIDEKDKKVIYEGAGESARKFYDEITPDSYEGVSLWKLIERKAKQK